jgi:exonuclease VII small subunit
VQEWVYIGSYARGLPLAKRCQIKLRPVDLARELFLQTQRDEFKARMSGHRS